MKDFPISKINQLSQSQIIYLLKKYNANESFKFYTSKSRLIMYFESFYPAVIRDECVLPIEHDDVGEYDRKIGSSSSCFKTERPKIDVQKIKISSEFEMDFDRSKTILEIFVSLHDRCIPIGSLESNVYYGLFEVDHCCVALREDYLRICKGKNFVYKYTEKEILDVKEVPCGFQDIKWIHNDVFLIKKTEHFDNRLAIFDDKITTARKYGIQKYYKPHDDYIHYFWPDYPHIYSDHKNNSDHKKTAFGLITKELEFRHDFLFVCVSHEYIFFLCDCVREDLIARVLALNTNTLKIHRIKIPMVSDVITQFTCDQSFNLKIITYKRILIYNVEHKLKIKDADVSDFKDEEYTIFNPSLIKYNDNNEKCKLFSENTDKTNTTIFTTSKKKLASKFTYFKHLFSSSFGDSQLDVYGLPFDESIIKFMIKYLETDEFNLVFLETKENNDFNSLFDFIQLMDYLGNIEYKEEFSKFIYLLGFDKTHRFNKNNDDIRWDDMKRAFDLHKKVVNTDVFCEFANIMLLGFCRLLKNINKKRKRVEDVECSKKK